jgi:hypothetical protein
MLRCCTVVAPDPLPKNTRSGPSAPPPASESNYNCPLAIVRWRVSEMRGLRWRDVDLAGRVVRLRPELSKNKDGQLLPLT